MDSANLLDHWMNASFASSNDRDRSIHTTQKLCVIGLNGCPIPHLAL